MTDQQLYLALGIPFLMFITNILVIMWQAKSTERTLSTRIDGLEKIMAANFDGIRQGILRIEQVADARLKWLEERHK